MTTQQSYNTLLAEKVIKELKNRNIQGYYCETKKEALETVLEMIPGNSVVSWGGSSTLKELGILDSLRNGAFTVLDPNSGKTGSEKDKIAHEALNSDYFLMSANAIAATGELVNMDGIGNRVAAMIYGPKNVIVIAGINKVEPNLDSAILHVKTKSAALIALRYSKTEITTYEELLKKAEASGSQLVITNMSTFKDRIRVVLVGENLGF